VLGENKDFLESFAYDFMKFIISNILNKILTLQLKIFHIILFTNRKGDRLTYLSVVIDGLQYGLILLTWSFDLCEI
jgi:hypothetical protein